MTSASGVALPTAWKLLRQSGRQAVLVAVLALALQVAVVLPLTLWQEQRVAVGASVAATVPEGDVIATAPAPIPAAALAGVPAGVCAVGEVTGQVIAEPGAPDAPSVPAYHRAARGPCAGAGLADGVSRLTPGEGAGSFEVMGPDRTRVRVTAQPPVSAATTRFAVDDPALARTLLGTDADFSTVALSGPGADSARIGAPEVRTAPRQAYIDQLAAAQVATTSFVKIIAEFFAVIVSACLLAALAFAATLLAMNQRPQLQILWRLGVPARTRAAILALQVAALVLAAAVGTIIVFAVIAAVVPPGWTALGTFTVDAMRATPATLLGSTLLVAVVLAGAFAFGMKLEQQDSASARSRLRGVPLVPAAGVALVAGGGYLVLHPPGGAFTWIVVGHCLLVLGAFALCAPLLTLVSRLRSVGTFRGVLLPWFGFGGIARARTQARVVVAFLVFVSSLVAVVSVFASSTNASISRQIDANVGAQFVAEPKAGFEIDQADVTALRAVPGPGTVLAVSPQQVTGSGGPLSGIAIDGSLDAGALLVTLREGTQSLTPGGALLSESTAKRIGARTGGTAEIAGTEYRVGGVYADAPTLGDFVIAANPGSRYAYVLMTAPPQSDLQGALSPAVPTGTVRSIGDYQIQQARESRQILAALQQLSAISSLGLLLALAVVLGVLNAGRSGEWRALARLGLRRGRIVATIAVEATAIAVLSVIAGLAAGIVTGIGVGRYLASSGLSDIVVDPRLVGSAFLALTAVGVAVYVLTSLGVLRRISF
ncbi:hypothetical protein TSST111916_10300 [Tsukamurella strandjordii]|uniref:hypothetical protein n=1 Tax=Tsukamurella TaxID=2060 RepID=UPI001C7D8145|nr:hypothetical protein [Tsukamurella sp. TY48]GIZ97013.1 hypothetical protein TTY48_16250 [Tsukamurella sp. TY48]